MSHSRRFVYLKTLKTAGTSVEGYFERYCMPEGEWSPADGRDEHVSDAGIVGFRGADPAGATWFNHMSADAVRALLGNEMWDDYFTFTTIRDPFDKMVSAFFHLGAGDRSPNSERGRVDAAFLAWLRDGGLPPDRDKYVSDGEICLDGFIRYESLRHDLRDVCDRVGVPFEPDQLPRYKTDTRDRSVQLGEIYTPEAIDIVAQRFAFEIEHFGYQPPAVRRRRRFWRRS